MKMRVKKVKEWVNVFVVKKPARAILIGILFLNMVLFAVSALVISYLSPESLVNKGFWASVFYTISMILDAGCIQYVVADIGEVGVGLVIACMCTVLIGMITFTGAVIGYVTNYISNFIESSNSGARSLRVSGHTVILNWNSRASEIVNDLLYSENKETIVILVSEGAEDVKKEIADRISTTIKGEKAEENETMKNRLSIIVREGDTYSTKELNDISISQAKTVILLSKEIQNASCKYDYQERREQMEKGNSNTVKTLVQVAQMTAAEDSADNQIIIVEIEDDWTLTLVNKIIEHKERLGKCNIIPVPVNKILGQILSQFSLMPELNTVYSELFSNKGAEFFCMEHAEIKNDNELIRGYLKYRCSAIPMTTMGTKTGNYAFYIADHEKDIIKETDPKLSDYQVKMKKNYWLEQKNVIIIGHNSKSEDIMNGFESFRSEWNFSDGREILNIIIIDDKKSLEKHDYYRKYPYVKHVVEADVFDIEKIYSAVNAFIDQNKEETSILILSDDTVATEDIDSNALTYLIYVQDIIFERKTKDPEFDRESIDVVVEILNPKNYDVVHNYSINNVVISNRYISKMVTQISRKEALYEFYMDILTYDEAGVEVYESKELYIKKVRRFFEEIPGPCTATELIRAVFDATPEENKAIVIGYVRPGGEMVLFSGNQNKIPVVLTERDRLIVFSNH